MQSIDAQIQQLRAELAAKHKRLKWLLSHRQLFEQAEVTNITFGLLTLDIDNPKRDEVERILRTFNAGKWTKEPNAGNNTTINYETELDGMKLRLWSAEPPPSCKLVEEEVEIPAQPARIEKRMKLVCA